MDNGSPVLRYVLMCLGRVCAESATNTSYDENWEHVSRKGKSNVTRGQEDIQGGRTLTSQIFGGTLQSTVKAARAKASVTVQPFNLLHLDINSSNNVVAALQMLTIAEDIHGELMCCAVLCCNVLVAEQLPTHR